MFKRFLQITIFCFVTLSIVTLAGGIDAALKWSENMQASNAITSLTGVSKAEIVTAYGSLCVGGAIGILVALLVVTLVFGRLYCAIICPVGCISDITAFTGEKVRGYRYRHLGKKSLVIRILFLVVIIGAAIAGWATIDPSYGTWRTLLGGLRLSALPSFIAACALFSALILLSFFGGRAYCNHICPIGTILGLVSRFSLYKVRIKHEKCPSGCTECEKHCRCGAIDPKSGKVNASLCINCLDCIRGVCPKDAIEFTPPQNKFFFSKDYKDLTK